MPKWFVTCKLGLCFFGIMPSTQLLPVGVLVIMKFNQRWNNLSLIISDQYNCLQHCPITIMPIFIVSSWRKKATSLAKLSWKSLSSSYGSSQLGWGSPLMFYMECFCNTWLTHRPRLRVLSKLFKDLLIRGMLVRCYLVS